MARFYQTVSPTEVAAYAAFHAIDGVFDAIDEVTGYGCKRYGNSLLWRCDDELPVVVRMLDALRQTGLFTEVREVSEEFFWSAKSHSM